jgi:hypothetical protein
MADRMITYGLFLLAFTTFGSVFYLILQGFDSFLPHVLPLVPLAFWVIFYGMRSVLAQKSRASPLQILQQAENIALYVLLLLTLLTQGATVYLLLSGRFNPSIYLILFTPLALSLFFYLGRSLLARGSPDTAIAVPSGLSANSATIPPDVVVIPSGPLVIE